MVLQVWYILNVEPSNKCYAVFPSSANWQKAGKWIPDEAIWHCRICHAYSDYQKIDGKFFPVGEENYAAAIKKPEGYVVILVDEDGYTKTQSKDLEKTEATEIYKKVIESGIAEYPKNEIVIWTEKFPAVQSELR